VSIDPGMAFGTGSHQTTQLCLLLLQRRMRAGARVLDVGAGSGILSIAAALLGASECLGVDVDPYAVRNARENAARNGVGGVAAFREGDLALGVDGRYDVVLANIVADAVIKLLPDARRLLAPGGVAILSGVIDAREEDVARAIKANGLAAAETLRGEGWAAFAAVAD